MKNGPLCHVAQAAFPQKCFPNDWCMPAGPKNLATTSDIEQGLGGGVPCLNELNLAQGGQTFDKHE